MNNYFEFKHYIIEFRKRWKILALVLIAFVILSLCAFQFLNNNNYSSSTSYLINSEFDESQNELVWNKSSEAVFETKSLKSYLKSIDFAKKVIASSNISASAQEVSDMINTEVQDDILLKITVQSPNKEYVNGVMNALTDKLNKNNGITSEKVKLVELQQPSISENSRFGLAKVLVMAILAGLVVDIILFMIVDIIKYTINTENDFIKNMEIDMIYSKEWYNRKITSSIDNEAKIFANIIANSCRGKTISLFSYRKSSVVDEFTNKVIEQLSADNKVTAVDCSESISTISHNKKLTVIQCNESELSNHLNPGGEREVNVLKCKAISESFVFDKMIAAVDESYLIVVLGKTYCHDAITVEHMINKTGKDCNIHAVLL